MEINLGLSTDVVSQFQDNYLDWIYIDAGHGYDDCLDDLKNSLKIVKNGGLILGDDYSEAKSGVKRAVEAFSKEYNLSFEIFSETDNSSTTSFKTSIQKHHNDNKTQI